jgi:hypothetical protein
MHLKNLSAFGQHRCDQRGDWPAKDYVGYVLTPYNAVPELSSPRRLEIEQLNAQATAAAA